MDWDQRYSEPGYAYGTAPNDFLVAVEKYLPRAGQVLSVAEGEGRNAVFLASEGHHVTAVDASSVGLKKAERLARQNNVHIQTLHTDLSQYIPDEAAWDGVISIFCHLPEHARQLLHERLVRSIRPGGVLLLEAYAPEQLSYGTGGPPTALLLASLEQLQQELHGLQWQHVWVGTRQVVEGLYHTGEAAVVQLVGLKPE